MNKDKDIHVQIVCSIFDKMGLSYESNDAYVNHESLYVMHVWSPIEFLIAIDVVCMLYTLRDDKRNMIIGPWISFGDISNPDWSPDTLIKNIEEFIREAK